MNVSKSEGGESAQRTGGKTTAEMDKSMRMHLEYRLGRQEDTTIGTVGMMHDGCGAFARRTPPFFPPQPTPCRSRQLAAPQLLEFTSPQNARARRLFA
jgi:hypothetical protein